MQDPTEEEVEELIRSVDGESGDRDGKIELREFLKLYTQGIDQAGKTNDTDINDCFASLGGCAPNARRATASLHST